MNKSLYQLFIVSTSIWLAGCGEAPTPTTTTPPSGLPPAIIEDGIPAGKKKQDEVSQMARKFFVEWLKGHGELQIIDDESGVGIAASDTRLLAFLYGSNEANNGWTAEVEFRIVIPDGREIVEFVAGMGETKEEAIGMAFNNFTVSTFHSVYSCFMNPADPHMTHEPITIGGKEFIITSGGMMIMGGRDLPEFGPVSDAFKKEISNLDLTDHPYWIKLVYGKMGDRVLSSSVTMCNDVEKDLSGKLDQLSWPFSEGFYLAKEFFILQPAASAPAFGSGKKTAEKE